VVLRAERVDLVDLGEAYRQGVPTHRLLAGLSRSTIEDGGQVEAVGVMGVVQARRGQATPAVPLAVAFLEWEDCRWWSWRGLLDANGRMILADTELYASAEQGDPLPATFGRWWSMGRRAGSAMHLAKAAPDAELVN